MLAGQQPPAAGQICAHLTPGVQRLLRRLDDVPVGVYDAAWTLIAWNPAWAALSPRRGGGLWGGAGRGLHAPPPRPATRMTMTCAT
jgi:hypothetical protein